MPDTANQVDLEFLDLERVSYSAAYEEQVRCVDRVLVARDAPGPSPAYVLLLEHDPPVITMTRRSGADLHLLAAPETLTEHGIELVETDRGGDVTYHGPGQLVAYAIVDLNALGMNLHTYMRFLEQVAIDTCAAFGITGRRDPQATGVWVGSKHGPDAEVAKICALGVRVRRWVTFHGLALNVTTNLDHFGLIVPCGLHGRGVTSMERELGADHPSMHDVKGALAEAFRSNLDRCGVMP